MAKEFGNDDITEMITKKKENRINNSGLVPLSISQFKSSRASIRNYKTMILIETPDVSMTITTIVKTDTRYTAGNSLILAMSFALVVAAMNSWHRGA